MNSIRRRLTIGLLICFVVLEGSGLCGLYWFARDSTIAEFDGALRAKALAVSKLIVETPDALRTDAAEFFLGVARPPAGDGDRPAPATDSYQRFLEEFRGAGRNNYFELWDTAGRPVARSKTLVTGDLPRIVRSSDVPLTWDFTEWNGEKGRAVGFVFHPDLFDGENRTRSDLQLTLVVAAEREALDRQLAWLRVITVGCGALLIGATLWVVPRGLRRGFRPLDRLGAEVASINAKSLGARISLPNAPAELDRIVGGLNALLARLEESFQNERRFSADVAHELRTPISELHGLAECALKWPDSRDESTDRDILAISRRMEVMVERLLALSRGDQGLLSPSLEDVDLAHLTASLWGSFSGRAAEHDLRVGLSLEPRPGAAWGDAVLAGAILTVLLENAVNYTPRGGALRIAICDGGASVGVEIENDAPDLGAADLDRMFDRFWRKDSARGGGVHVGLGLALARSYAAAMGWTLSARLDGRGRLLMSLQGPRAAIAASRN